jgi:hypothetical protein
MAQVVSRRLHTAYARGSRPGQSMWDLWWTKWHWDRFFVRVFRFSPVNIIPSCLSIHICNLGDELDGRSSETLSHPIDMNNGENERGIKHLS